MRKDHSLKKNPSKIAPAIFLEAVTVGPLQFIGVQKFQGAIQFRRQWTRAYPEMNFVSGKRIGPLLHLMI